MPDIVPYTVVIVVVAVLAVGLATALVVDWLKSRDDDQDPD